MIVVDTHILVWDALAPERLSEKSLQALSTANQQDGIIVCDISLWEIAMLLAKGRISVVVDSEVFINLILQANKIRVASITPQIAALAVNLPEEINKDPADRLIAATAMVEGYPLVTADQNLQASPLIDTLW